MVFNSAFCYLLSANAPTHSFRSFPTTAGNTHRGACSPMNQTDKSLYDYPLSIMMIGVFRGGEYARWISNQVKGVKWVVYFCCTPIVSFDTPFDSTKKNVPLFLLALGIFALFTWVSNRDGAISVIKYYRSKKWCFRRLSNVFIFSNHINKKRKYLRYYD